MPALTAIQLFKLLSDPTRLNTLLLLLDNRELCVCDLCSQLGLSQPKMSRHLALLKASGLLQDRRAGIWVYYQLHPSLPLWAYDILRQARRVTELPSAKPSPCCDNTFD